MNVNDLHTAPMDAKTLCLITTLVLKINNGNRAAQVPLGSFSEDYGTLRFLYLNPPSLITEVGVFFMCHMSHLLLMTSS